MSSPSGTEAGSQAVGNAGESVFFTTASCRNSAPSSGSLPAPPPSVWTERSNKQTLRGATSSGSGKRSFRCLALGHMLMTFAE